MPAPAAGPRTVLVPDLDDELLATLGQLEELLLMLSGDAGDAGDDADLDALPNRSPATRP